MTLSHVIVILLIQPCQLSSKSNSHISPPLLRLYKSQCIFHTVSHSDIVQQCIQISNRINSSNVHTYILRLFYIASSIRIFILIDPIFNSSHPSQWFSELHTGTQKVQLDNSTQHSRVKGWRSDSSLWRWQVWTLLMTDIFVTEFSETISNKNAFQ